ncbi:MAG: hypothetical protein WC916_00490 [Candidatus Woesearchaeota archaeon]
MVGFDSILKEEQNELQNFYELRELIAGTIRTDEEFEKTLRLEFKNVEDLKNNLETIEQQLISITALTEKREQITMHLITLYEQRVTQVDITKCKELLAMIAEIDRKISPMVTRIVQELPRLYIKETHDLYQKHKTIMDAIDEKARFINVRIQQITHSINGSGDAIRNIDQMISRLERERMMNKEIKKDKIGF